MHPTSRVPSGNFSLHVDCVIKPYPADPPNSLILPKYFPVILSPHLRNAYNSQNSAHIFLLLIITRPIDYLIYFRNLNFASTLMDHKFL